MKRLLIIIFLFVFSITSWAATLTASVNRNSISLGETLTYTLILRGSVTASRPDLSALTKQFDVLGTSANREISVINGKTTEIIRWIVLLSPKYKGKVSIPAIQIGKAISKPITVTIGAPSNVALTHNVNGSLPAVFMTASVDSKKAYVQSQILYTLKLYTIRAIRAGGIAPPEAANAKINQIGQGIRYKSTSHGQTYDVLERHYVIFPQKAGPITINPGYFEGMVAMPYNNNQGYGFSPFFSPLGKHVRLSAKPITIKINPKPADFHSPWWLPAKNISLQESWSQPITNLKVGQPVTVTLTIKAQGLSAQQLPTMSFPKINGLNVYPDQPKTNTTASSNGIVGVRTLKIAIVPTRTGNFTIPSMHLNWWNIKTNRAMVARIAAKTLHVMQAASVNRKKTVKPGPAAQSNRHANASKPSKPAQVMLPVPKMIQTNHQPWQWIAIGFGLLWLFTLLLWWRKSGAQVKDKSFSNKPRAKINKARQAIYQACLNNDAKQTKQALMHWATLRWPEKHLLGILDIAMILNSAELKAALMKLDAAIYSSDKTPWDGDSFWQLFSGLKDKGQDSPRDQDDLSPLYLK